MADLKTKPTGASVAAFLNAVEDPNRRRDAKSIARLMKAVSGKRPQLWGPSIVGYGAYHYQYASGREGDYFRIGFSPRKQNLTIYLMPGYRDFGPLLKKLGKHKIGKSCLYLRSLEDVRLDVLEKMVQQSWDDMQRRYPE